MKNKYSVHHLSGGCTTTGWEVCENHSDYADVIALFVRESDARLYAAVLNQEPETPIVVDYWNQIKKIRYTGVATNDEVRALAGELMEALQWCWSANREITQRSPDKTAALLSLVDGAYDIIELWRADSPSQKVWREDWLKKAKKLGAQPI